MSFKKILSQSHVVASFQSVLSRGRLAHAYMFHGPEGVGKALFARELSKALLCQEGRSDACDTCESCRGVDTGRNPNLSWITAGYKVITIASIQELERLAALKPVEAKRRVFVIEDAERMSSEAANCLLKTLEEPPPGVVILLTTTSPPRLPRTIISRCQLVRFHPIDPGTLKGLITENFGVEGDGLEWLTAASCGSMGRAANLLKEDAITRRKRLIERLFSLHIEDNFSISQEVLDWCPGEKDEGLEARRSRLRIWMCVMLEYYRDILLCKAGAEEVAGLFNSDERDRIQAKAGRLSMGTITDIMDEIKYSLEALRRNANINLLVENMFTRIARLETTHH
ncbi:MAG: DNA polymerase III subunit delta' [Candidatus Brocadiales bacterium]|nr:DNA polymerase III subunit delta' [Candidatus Bathyanammoxibius amoris]